jgi:HAD superfamily hydrolase (TIGR01549 family)
MIEKYRHISFDLDGTLVHTVPEYRHKILPEIIKTLGGSVKEIHSIDKFWFESGRDRIIRNEFNLEPEIFWELFRKIDTPKERSKHTTAYPDAEKAIKKLKNSSKVISIITGAPAWIAEMEIGKLNDIGHDYYLSIHGGGFKSKPDPKSFFHVLNKLSLKPEETLYIGNSNEDAFYAKNAGVDFLYLERKEHKFDLADYSIGKIHSLDELF